MFMTSICTLVAVSFSKLIRKEKILVWLRESHAVKGFYHENFFLEQLSCKDQPRKEYFFFFFGLNLEKS